MNADTRAAAWQAVHDPATTPDRLAAIAAAHPEFAAAIAAHPQAYPELREWAAAAQAAPPVVVARPVLPPMPDVPAAVIASTPVVPAATAAQTPGAVIGALPEAEPARRRTPSRRLVLGLVGGGLAVVLVGAGVGGWALVAGMFGGASSPQAAVEKALGAAANGDPMALLGTLAPSELDAFRPTVETLAAVKGEGEIDYLGLITRIGEAGELRVEDVSYTTTRIADGVAIVTATAGTITIDGDPDRLATALMDTGADVFRAMDAAGAQSATETEGLLDDARNQLASTLRDSLPFTWDIAQTARDASDGREDLLSPWTVVTVDEGGWYISPLLSAAELYARVIAKVLADVGSSSNGTEIMARRGDEVPSSARFDSPGTAARGVADALVQAANGDIAALAATLSLPERRLAALYGPLFFDEEWLWSSGPDFTVDSVAVTPEIDGDRAQAFIDDVAVRYTDGYDSSLGGGLRLRGTCWEWTRTGAPNYDAYLGEYDDGVRSGSGCLSDWSGSSVLGLDDARAVFVKEDGGWVLSPLRSVGAATEQAASRLAALVEDDRLAELWGTR